jgi:hypothetical protein
VPPPRFTISRARALSDIPSSQFRFESRSTAPARSRRSSLAAELAWPANPGSDWWLWQLNRAKAPWPADPATQGRIASPMGCPSAWHYRYVSFADDIFFFAFHSLDWLYRCEGIVYFAFLPHDVLAGDGPVCTCLVMLSCLSSYLCIACLYRHTLCDL